MILPTGGIVEYRRQPIELESPEQFGYDRIKYNLAESSVTDAVIDNLDLDLSGLTLWYGDHLGHPGLREVISAEGDNISPDDVLVTTGAALALFAVNTSLLGRGGHAIIAHPNYVTNVETPRAIGADPQFLKLNFDDCWQVDIDLLEAKVRPDTRLISLTCPHNPTGTVMSINDLHRVIDIVESNECYLLLDETYRDMTFGTKLPLAASLSKRAISISSMSKSYGLPGIRMGWAICRDKEFMQTLLAAKEQIIICNSVIEEEIAFRIMSRKDEYMSGILQSIRTGLGIMSDWIENQSVFEWVKPQGGCVAFIRFRETVMIDTSAFHQLLNDKYGTFVGPGHWFEMDKRYMRVGFGWASHDDLKSGLDCLSKAASELIRQ